MSYIKSILGGNPDRPTDMGPAAIVINPDLPTSWGIVRVGRTTTIECLESLTIRWTTNKADTMCSKNGDEPIDRFITGQSLTIELTSQDTSLETAEAIAQGFDLVLDDNGDPVNGVFTSRVGASDQAEAVPIIVKRIIDGVISPDPMNWLTIPRGAPSSETIEWVRDVSTQLTVPATFRAYPSSVEYDGRPVLGLIGSLDDLRIDE